MECSEDLLKSLIERGIAEAEPGPTQADVREHGVGPDVVARKGIARERSQMYGPGQESLLNNLLNEMDGLREDADVLFILTTNRPDQLEPALASRPGRIDQAIEFPLPDDEGRAKLATLYARGLDVPAPAMDLIVRRTEGASPAFVKELMRRAAQFQIEQRAGAVLRQESVGSPVEEMVFYRGGPDGELLGRPGAGGGQRVGRQDVAGGPRARHA